VGDLVVSAGEILLWIILPYAAVATFVVGTWWRYRADQFGWTSGSTQLFEQKILGWAGPAFHYGALAAIGGHVIGLMIPKSFTEAVGMSESTYRWFSAVAGAVAGVVCVVGSGWSTGGSRTSGCAARHRGPTCWSTSCWSC
jgi:respiratory nitrate reductase gamma subunit